MAQRRSGADTRVRTFAAFKRIAGDQLDETVIVDVLQELYDAGVLAGVSARPAALTQAEVDFLDEHSGVRENGGATWDFTPLDVQDFVMNVQLAHPSRSRVVGLLEWLRSGADPTPAIEIAAEQDDTI